METDKPPRTHRSAPCENRVRAGSAARGLGLRARTATDGWFVVNVRDAEWWFTDTRHAACNFENEYGEPRVEFSQFGINLTVLEPGQSNGFYHSESAQEAFLVLSGECRLLVEGEERLLGRWDFFHSPPLTDTSSWAPATGRA